MSDFISLQDYKKIQSSVSMATNFAQIVVSGIKLTANIATKLGTTLINTGMKTFLTSMSSILSALGVIGLILAVGEIVYSLLSAMWAVDSIKRARDKVLLVFRKAKRVIRCIAPNKVIKYATDEYLNLKVLELNELKKQIEISENKKRSFISSYTNTYLLSAPILTFLTNEQNVLKVIKDNNYDYIDVVSFKDYISDYNILQLDKIRINTSDNETLSQYIDNLNAIHIILDRISEYNLEQQVIEDINFIRNNINILLEYIKKSYIEQLQAQDITDPENMLIELTKNIPFLDLSSYGVGNLQNFPQQFLIKDINTMFNKINKKSLMVLLFNNIYIEKFIGVMLVYKQKYSDNNEVSLINDINNLIEKSLLAYNYLNEIISLKLLFEKYENQPLPDKIYSTQYDNFTNIKKLVIDKIGVLFSKYDFIYKKSNDVIVSNKLIFVKDLFDIETYFYKSFYNSNYLNEYIDFDTNDENQKYVNIDKTQIEVYNLNGLYDSIFNEVYIWLEQRGIPKNKIEINTFDDFLKNIFLLLGSIQTEIDKYYSLSQDLNIEYSFKKYSINNNRLLYENLKDNIKLKECIYVDEYILNEINKKYIELYKIRFDFAYQYSILSNLFLNEQIYFFFEIFSKIESIVNSSNGLIYNNRISDTEYGIQIDFYEIMYEFFTNYINYYSGYILRNNNYLTNITKIANTNFISVLTIACNYQTIEMQEENLANSEIKVDTNLIKDSELLLLLEKNIDNYVFDTGIITETTENILTDPQNINNDIVPTIKADSKGELIGIITLLSTLLIK